MTKIAALTASGVLILLFLAGNAGALTFVQPPGSPYATTEPAYEPFGGGFLGGLAAGDFNGDGISDVAVVNATGVPPMRAGESVTVLLGSSSGALTVAPGSPVEIYGGGIFSSKGAIAAADFNGDRHPDLAVVDEVHSTVSILLGDGTGRFKPAGASIAFSSGGSVPLLGIGDVNGDGRPDLVVAGDSVTVFLGDGTGGFSAAPGTPRTLPASAGSLAVADFTGDGRADIAVGVAHGLTVLLGSSTGEPQPAPGSPLPLGTTPQDMTAADLNGDGKLDLAMADPADGAAIVLLGDGHAGFTAAPRSPFHVPDGVEDPYRPGIPDSIAVGDFGSDGHLDLALANFNGSSDNIAVLEGDGTGDFANASGSPFPVTGNPRPIVVGDFNGDAAQDLAVAHGFLGRVSVLESSTTTGSSLSGPGLPESANPGRAAVPYSSPSPPPEIHSLSLSRRVIRAGRGAFVLTFALARGATVVVNVDRVAVSGRGNHVHSKLTLVRSFTTKGKAGLNRFTVKRTARFHLAPGRYRIIVYTVDGTLRSSARTLSLVVKR